MVMRVLFIPYNDKGNPYQRLLANSLSTKEGVNVSFGTTSRLFSILRSSHRQWKPDILHLHWHHPFLLGGNVLKTLLKSVTFLVELCILKLLRIKLVWTVHNIYNHEKRFVSLELFFSRLLARLSDKIIVHSRSAKKEVEKAFGLTGNSRIVVVPHGNYISAYKNTIGRSQARKQLRIPSTATVFLYFGLIRPYKGVLELISAFKKLGNSQARLFIIGKPLDDQLAEKVREKRDVDPRIRVVFEFIPDDKIQVFMNAADVVVLPYRDVLTSGAVILAMSFGKPVIAPRMGCIPDVLDDRGSFLYDPSDEKGLLKAMRLALDANLAEMGKHNFELAKQLDWDEIGRRTYELYQEVLSK